MPRYFGTILVVTLVALRLATGWHFFKEGADHLQDDDFSASAVLWTAKGPFAPMFRAYIPDGRGYSRLNAGYTIDKLWKGYVEDAANQYGFNQDQRKQANDRFKARANQLKWYLADNDDDIKEVFNEWARLDEAMKDRSLADVNFRRSWIEQKEAELRSKSRPWMQQVTAIRKSLEDDLYAIHTAANTVPGPKITFPDPGKSWVDSAVTWLTFVVGVCLVLGLFTRPAAIAGALFLLSVILTQPPWVPGAADTYYQTVEMLALLVLAAAGAGRWGGLDFFLHSLWRSFRGTKSATASPEGASA